MYYAIKFENGRHLAFDTVLNKHYPKNVSSYTMYGSDGTTDVERDTRAYYQNIVDSWFTTDLNKARYFDSVVSARSAGIRGPYKFEIVEIELNAREKQ